MILSALKKLVKNEDLTSEEIKSVMVEILCENPPRSLVAAFLAALRTKGETIEEITACVELIRKYGLIVPIENKNAIDIVGTGGDGANTFNISTTAAFIIAAGGLNVAKHGNRASSSKSGAADVLEALGANIALDETENKEVFEKTGICFIFAPKYSPLLKNVADVRRELKIRTIFNLLGPLINPSGVKMQLIGVYDKKLVNPIVHVMKNLGVENGMTLFGECGLDEASVVSKTFFTKVQNGIITDGEFIPEDFGIKRAELADIKGDSPIENAQIMKDIFSNKIKGAKKDVAALNAALAFFTAGQVNNIKNGLELAYDIIDSGAALKKLNQFIKETNEYTR